MESGDDIEMHGLGEVVALDVAGTVIDGHVGQGPSAGSRACREHNCSVVTLLFIRNFLGVYKAGFIAHIELMANALWIFQLEGRCFKTRDVICD